MEAARVKWGRQKFGLLFCGFLCKMVAVYPDPIPFAHADQIHFCAIVLFGAFDATFLWLLTPPTPRAGDGQENKP